jgi:hypothetical protein
MVFGYLVDYFVDALGLSVWWESLDLSFGGSLKEPTVFGLTKHFLVVLEHLFRQTLKDPIVLESFQRCHPIDWMPLKAPSQKVEEPFISRNRGLQNLFKSLGIRFPLFPPRIRNNKRLVVIVKEEMPPGGKL